MSREEKLGRCLIDFYGLCVMPWTFHHSEVTSWKVYLKDFGPAYCTYEFSSWKTLLFGKPDGRESIMAFNSTKCPLGTMTLNEYVSALSTLCRGIYCNEVLDFSSLDELDILLTLAGKNISSEL